MPTGTARCPTVRRDRASAATARSSSARAAEVDRRSRHRATRPRAAPLTPEATAVAISIGDTVSLGAGAIACPRVEHRRRTPSSGQDRGRRQRPARRRPSASRSAKVREAPQRTVDGSSFARARASQRADAPAAHVVGARVAHAGPGREQEQQARVLGRARPRGARSGRRPRAGPAPPLTVPAVRRRRSRPRRRRPPARRARGPGAPAAARRRAARSRSRDPRRRTRAPRACAARRRGS